MSLKSCLVAFGFIALGTTNALSLPCVFFIPFYKPQGADDSRFLSLFLFMDNAEASLIAKRDDKLCERLIGYSAPQLTVQGIDSGLSERVSIYFIDRFQKIC